LSDSKPTSFREKALASLATTAGMLLFLAAYLILETYGLAGRIVFYEYLPGREFVDYPLAGMLGASLGARVYRLFNPRIHYSRARLATGCLLGVGLGFAAVALPTFSSLESGWLQKGALFGVVVIPVVGAWLGGIIIPISPPRR